MGGRGRMADVEGKYADAAIESIQTENCSAAFITPAAPHSLVNKLR